MGPSARAQTVTATVPVGKLPFQLAVNPVTNTVYVTNSSNLDNTVTVIDGATNATSAVNVGLVPQPIAVNPVKNTIFVGNYGANTVTVINGVTHATATVMAGFQPGQIAVNSVTNKIYVANYGDGTVTVIDGVTLATATVPVGTQPDAIGINSTTNKVYVVNDGSNTVTVIDGGSNAPTTVPVGARPYHVGVNSVTNTIYVGNSGDNTVTVIDGATNVTAVVPVGGAPRGVGVNSATNKIYVATSGNAVTVIDGATLATTTVPVGTSPSDVGVNSVTNTIYAVNSGDNTVTAIDGATHATSTVNVGNVPIVVGVNSATNRVYVLNAGDDTVSVIEGAAGSPSPTPTPTPTPTPPGGGGGGGGAGGGSGSARLINISTRAVVGTGANILIPGFVISGTGTETLLIRGDGPALTGFGVAGALAQPSLSVFDSGGHIVASNTGWETNSNPALITSTAATVGAFSFAAGSLDCALIASLPAGAYTVQISGVGNTSGVALAEVFEVSSTGTRLANISTRADVGTGANIIIAGFVISGSGTEQLLVRGAGPGLAQFGVGGLLAQPSLSVFDSASISIASNTGWTTASDPSGIASTAATVGAFAFPAGSADSAQIVNLTGGAYTLQISGADNSTGVALAEVYEVP